MRYINIARVAAAQLTTPAENPLVTDSSRMVDVWFAGPVVRKQLFKKVTREEQDRIAAQLVARGCIRTGNLLIDPSAVLFAEMENQLLGGLVTIGYQENGKPVELKVGSGVFAELCASLAGER